MALKTPNSKLQTSDLKTSQTSRDSHQPAAQDRWGYVNQSLRLRIPPVTLHACPPMWSPRPRSTPHRRPSSMSTASTPTTTTTTTTINSSSSAASIVGLDHGGLPPPGVPVVFRPQSVDVAGAVRVQQRGLQSEVAAATHEHDEGGGGRQTRPIAGDGGVQQVERNAADLFLEHGQSGRWAERFVEKFLPRQIGISPPPPSPPPPPPPRPATTDSQC